jgi:hypothetical protein
MTIQEFGKKYRVKTREDNCGETIAPGKGWGFQKPDGGGHIYEYSTTEMGAIFVTPVSKPARTMFWNKMRKACSAAGMTLRQCGDAEGAFSFDPENSEHVRLAMKLAGVRPKRRMSPNQLALLATVGFKAKRPTVEGPSAT